MPEIVFTSEAQLRRPRHFLRQMATDLVAAREQAWWLFVSDLRAQHRQSLLGYLWIVLPPLVTTLTWVFLNGIRVINIAATEIPYPVYVLIGTMLWQLFLDTLNSPLNQMTKSRHLLTKVRLPGEALLLGGLADVLFNFAVRLLLIVAVLIGFRLPLTPMMILAPAGMLALLLLGLMIGTFLTPIGLLYRDVQRTLGLITTLWFFATPVVYPLPGGGRLAWLMALNPVTPLLVTTRELLTTGRVTQPGRFLLVTGFTVVLLAAGWVFYRLSLPHLVSRMSNR